MPEARFRALVLLIAASLLGAAAGAAQSRSGADEIHRGRTGLAPCSAAGRPDASETLCGTVPVLENRSAARGRRIDLHVVVVPAIGVSSRPPLFSFEGGPGLAASDGAELWQTELKAFRQNRDIVLFDQRGTGSSNPLHCERERRDAGDFLTEMYPTEYVRRCRSELQSRADLTRYTTIAAADDVEDVRLALGYGRIDIAGLSYGTRLALVYMRRHPKSVHAAVLMGVTPTWARLPLFHAANAQRALSLLLEDCAAEAACAAAYPDLAADLARVRDALGRAPARVSAAWPAGSPPKEVSITRDVFFETLRRQMYAPATSRRIPAVLHAAALGDYAPFLAAALPAGDGRDRGADGLYLSITCSEDTSRITPEEAERAASGTAFGPYRIDQQRRACSLWPTAPLPARYFRDVRSSAPVLILSGGRDPVTPPEWATRVARRLSRSRHVVVPLSAHLVEGLDDLGCWDGVVLSFLDSGTADGLDVSCLSRLKPAAFDAAREARGGGR
ncbi:MAG: alpha/beta hydrolase [Acidobacteria bacterium]|nr:alpha/beta hydrolase [Acidobacteriota bacterium]MCA1611887.1 alpha/beta hydrolase [Acidobacteriota bacterium]